MNAAKWAKWQQYSKKSFVEDHIFYESICMKCLEQASAVLCCAKSLQLYLTLCDPMDNSPTREFSRQEYWGGLP